MEKVHEQQDILEVKGGPETARLVSLNVGLPQGVAWHGRTVRTAVWKKPVQGKRMVRPTNIDGDGQGDVAGHGGENRAVLVYQLDSYRYWQEQLHRADFTFGQFGENFTVEGLADNDVCIGDRYRIGGALFEVTQPRVTCYRVGIRMNEPRMAALLVSHGRPGFYLRVLEEGEVQAGDEIFKVLRGPEAMSVAEINALLYLPNHARQQLERAIRIPALSAGWRHSLQALLQQQLSGEKTTGNSGLTSASGPSPAWPGFRPLRVSRIARECDNVFSLELVSVNNHELAAAMPGQFIFLRVHPHSEGPPVLRCYSLSGRPGTDCYRLGIKREPSGAASNFLTTELKVGDILEASAPRGRFVLRTDDRPVVLISAGIGVTPVLAMLHALAAEPSARRVWWLYGARSGSEHPFVAEVRSLLSRMPHSRSFVQYSKPRAEDFQGVHFDAVGHLETKVLESLGVSREADFYLCGPAGFLRDFTAGLASWGVAPERVNTEIFGAGKSSTPGIVQTPVRSPHSIANQPGHGPRVSFAKSGVNVDWDPACNSLLELAEACDVPVQWACRTGVCHTCETALIAGAVNYAPEPIESPADGNVLTCCSRPREDIILDL
ncbi:MAG TPA: MOSC and FAD-binding oxidoreductase domain-containing protein [Verrucomicrobiae bacterium]